MQKDASMAAIQRDSAWIRRLIDAKKTADAILAKHKVVFKMHEQVNLFVTY